jgi:hypothetical protein
VQRRRAGGGEGRRGGTIPLRRGGGARVVSLARARPLVVITAAHLGGGRWGLGWKRRSEGREAGARRRVGAAAAVAGLGALCSYMATTLLAAVSTFRHGLKSKFSTLQASLDWACSVGLTCSVGPF